MKFIFCLLLFMVFVSFSSCLKVNWNPDLHGYHYQQAIPQDIMVDIINYLGLSLLEIHNENNHNNIALSPYGAASILVAIGEGLRGSAGYEIQHAMHLPDDISVIRVGLRDIHRHLKSYFIPKEGFLAGLTLSRENVTLNPKYEDILRFYGYDLESFNNALYPEPVTTTLISITRTTDQNTPTSTLGDDIITHTMSTTIIPESTITTTVVPMTETRTEPEESTESESESTMVPTKVPNRTTVPTRAPTTTTEKMTTTRTQRTTKKLPTRETVQSTYPTTTKISMKTTTIPPTTTTIAPETESEVSTTEMESKPPEIEEKTEEEEATMTTTMQTTAFTTRRPTTTIRPSITTVKFDETTNSFISTTNMEQPSSTSLLIDDLSENNGENVGAVDTTTKRTITTQMTTTVESLTTTLRPKTKRPKKPKRPKTTTMPPETEEDVTKTTLTTVDMPLQSSTAKKVTKRTTKLPGEEKIPATTTKPKNKRKKKPKTTTVAAESLMTTEATTQPMITTYSPASRVTIKRKKPSTEYITSTTPFEPENVEDMDITTETIVKTTAVPITTHRGQLPSKDTSIMAEKTTSTPIVNFTEDTVDNSPMIMSTESITVSSILTTESSTPKTTELTTRISTISTTSRSTTKTTTVEAYTQPTQTETISMQSPEASITNSINASDENGYSGTTEIIQTTTSTMELPSETTKQNSATLVDTILMTPVSTSSGKPLNDNKDNEYNSDKMSTSSMTYSSTTKIPGSEPSISGVLLEESEFGRSGINANDSELSVTNNSKNYSGVNKDTVVSFDNEKHRQSTNEDAFPQQPMLENTTPISYFEYKSDENEDKYVTSFVSFDENEGSNLNFDSSTVKYDSVYDPSFSFDTAFKDDLNSMNSTQNINQTDISKMIDDSAQSQPEGKNVTKIIDDNVDPTKSGPSAVLENILPNLNLTEVMTSPDAEVEIMDLPLDDMKVKEEMRMLEFGERIVPKIKNITWYPVEIFNDTDEKQEDRREETTTKEQTKSKIDDNDSTTTYTEGNFAMGDIDSNITIKTNTDTKQGNTFLSNVTNVSEDNEMKNENKTKELSKVFPGINRTYIPVPPSNSYGSNNKSTDDQPLVVPTSNSYENTISSVEDIGYTYEPNTIKSVFDSPLPAFNHSLEEIEDFAKSMEGETDNVSVRRDPKHVALNFGQADFKSLHDLYGKHSFDKINKGDIQLGAKFFEDPALKNHKYEGKGNSNKNLKMNEDNENNQDAFPDVIMTTVSTIFEVVDSNTTEKKQNDNNEIPENQMEKSSHPEKISLVDQFGFASGFKKPSSTKEPSSDSSKEELDVAQQNHLLFSQGSGFQPVPTKSMSELMNKKVEEEVESQKLNMYTNKNASKAFLNIKEHVDVYNGNNANIKITSPIWTPVLDLDITPPKPTKHILEATTLDTSNIPNYEATRSSLHLTEAVRTSTGPVENNNNVQFDQSYKQVTPYLSLEITPPEPTRELYKEVEEDMQENPKQNITSNIFSDGALPNVVEKMLGKSTLPGGTLDMPSPKPTIKFLGNIRTNNGHSKVKVKPGIVTPVKTEETSNFDKKTTPILDLNLTPPNPTEEFVGVLKISPTPNTGGLKYEDNLESLKEPLQDSKEEVNGSFNGAIFTSVDGKMTTPFITLTPPKPTQDLIGSTLLEESLKGSTQLNYDPTIFENGPRTGLSTPLNFKETTPILSLEITPPEPTKQFVETTFQSGVRNNFTDSSHLNQQTTPVLSIEITPPEPTTEFVESTQEKEESLETTKYATGTTSMDDFYSSAVPSSDLEAPLSTKIDSFDETTSKNEETTKKFQEGFSSATVIYQDLIDNINSLPLGTLGLEDSNLPQPIINTKIITERDRVNAFIETSGASAISIQIENQFEAAPNVRVESFNLSDLSNQRLRLESTGVSVTPLGAPQLERNVIVATSNGSFGLKVVNDDKYKSAKSDRKENSPRKTRSVVDYVIARYYDTHFSHNNHPPPYEPKREFTFLVNGKIRESNVNYMTYDAVLPFQFSPQLNALALKFPLDSPKYYLLLLLPADDDGIDRLIHDVRRMGSLRRLISTMKYTHVKASIPSFMLKGYVVLTPSLQKLGIKKIFEPRQADFSEMTNDRDTYVTNVEQAVTVTIRNYVDPEVLRDVRNLHQFETVEFKADHPFLYFVMDSDINVALMAGKIINPLNSRIR